MSEDEERYDRCVNPAWRQVLGLCGLDEQPVAADGCWLRFADGRRMLDFVCGYGAAALGHNPPPLLAALAGALGEPEPNLHPLGLSRHAGLLAERLLALAGFADGKAVFASGGAEAVEGALKLARMAGGKTRLIAFDGGFHGLTQTATQLAGAEFWRLGLADDPACLRLPWGELEPVAAQLEAGDVAAVLLEPVQGTAGARAWRGDRLAALSALCRRHGAWLVYDEVQSGLGRCGAWFAYQALGAPPPDMLVLAKGLSGGMLPVSALLCRDAVHQAVFGRPGCAKIHGSTFGGNRLALQCGLAMLRLLGEMDAPARAAAQGEALRRMLPPGPFALEGTGLMLALRATPQAHRLYGEQAAGALWLQLLEQGVLTAPAAHDADALRLLPPLTAGADELDFFVQAYRRALAALQTEATTA
ncbi:aspartate aminotransferase family protein [Chromobacterium sp. CV08]|uniref:aspartate aminotransferase family protein n=1 Tax=Chromobacterium sp. CV08 TaxID=3133274 RepID=UPI003DA83D12